ncbi:GNAT family N-acetyltransferase [Paraburkholderia ginsengiterrae]|nr:GNAT family N-acetyltransferase [Paraburkholderia ginsengiterrae]
MTLIEGFLVAEDARGSLVASAGLELLGSSVLLRSLAVSSKWRGKGIARELVTRLEDIARARGQHEVWLLTTTAQRFFERSGGVDKIWGRHVWSKLQRLTYWGDRHGTAMEDSSATTRNGRAGLDLLF